MPDINPTFELLMKLLGGNVPKVNNPRPNIPELNIPKNPLTDALEERKKFDLNNPMVAAFNQDEFGSPAAGSAWLDKNPWYANKRTEDIKLEPENNWPTAFNINSVPGPRRNIDLPLFPDHRNNDPEEYKRLFSLMLRGK